MRSAGGAVGAVPHGRSAPDPRSRPRLGRARRLGVRGRAPRVHAAALLRRRDRHPHLPPPCVRPGRPLPAARRRLGTRSPGAERGRDRYHGACPALRTTAACRREELLPPLVPPRRAHRRRLPERPALAPPRDPHAEPGGSGVRRRGRGRGGAAPRGPRARSVRDRLCEGDPRHSRPSPRRRRKRPRPDPGGARRRRGDALAREPPRQRRPRQPRPHEPRGPGPAPRSGAPHEGRPPGDPLHPARTDGRAPP